MDSPACGKRDWTTARHGTDTGTDKLKHIAAAGCEGVEIMLTRKSVDYRLSTHGDVD